MSIDKVLARSTKYDLSCDGDLRVFFEADGTLLLVAIIEYYCDTCLCYSSLPALVDEVLRSRGQCVSSVTRERPERTCKF